MTRRYTAEEKQIVLERLIANNGDVPLTSAQSGVNMTTLYKWRKLSNLHLSPLSLLSPNSPNTPVPLAKDDVQELTDLKHTLMQSARLLVESIAPAIAEAPLQQRISGAVQVIDRIMRMSAELPKTDEDETVVIEVAHHVEKRHAMEQE